MTRGQHMVTTFSYFTVRVNRASHFLTGALGQRGALPRRLVRQGGSGPWCATRMELEQLTEAAQQHWF